MVWAVARVPRTRVLNQTAGRAGPADYHDDYPVSAALAAWAAKSDFLGEIHVDSPRSALAHQARHQHLGYATSSKQQRYARRR